MPVYYPPVGFHFRVSGTGLTAVDDDVRFTEVGGLSVELSTEEVPEGGQNRYVQKYPGRAKYPELVLKRGLLKRSEITTWIQRCIDDFDIEPRDVDVVLLDEERNPLVTWHLVGAYPTKWSVSDLNATGNTFVVETLQLYYRSFTLNRGQ